MVPGASTRKSTDPVTPGTGLTQPEFLSDNPCAPRIAGLNVSRRRESRSFSTPLISRDGVLPVKLLLRSLALRRDIVVRDLEHFGISSPPIAVRPVAAKHQPVIAEGSPDFIQTSTVEIDLR